MGQRPRGAPLLACVGHEERCAAKNPRCRALALLGSTTLHIQSSSRGLCQGMASPGLSPWAPESALESVIAPRSSPVMATFMPRTFNSLPSKQPLGVGDTVRMLACPRWPPLVCKPSSRIPCVVWEHRRPSPKGMCGGEAENVRACSWEAAWEGRSQGPRLSQDFHSLCHLAWMGRRFQLSREGPLLAQGRGAPQAERPRFQSRAALPEIWSEMVIFCQDVWKHEPGITQEQ